MNYKVIVNHFIDTDGTPYYKGEVYPYRNEGITEEHIKYLATNKNKLGKALIEEVSDDKPKRRSTKTSKNETGDN